MYGRNESYKYLGKELSLSGECKSQVTNTITLIYQNQLVTFGFKVSALNNLALAKVIRHLCNTRIDEVSLQKFDDVVTSTVRKMYGLYSTTTQVVIYLPRKLRGIGIKRISNVYRTTRLAFLIKMLNHPVQSFSYVARESLKLDMKKRNVDMSTDEDNNFLGYELKCDGDFLKSKSSFGSYSAWPEMLRYARKIGIRVCFLDDNAMVLVNGRWLDDKCDLQKALFNITVERELEKAKSLSIQGSFLGMEDIQLKSSHSFLYTTGV